MFSIACRNMLHTIQQRPVLPSDRVSVGVSTGSSSYASIVVRAMGRATDFASHPPLSYPGRAGGGEGL